MASIERRIEALEAQFAGEDSEAEDPAGEFRKRFLRAILDEYARLKSSKAVHYRGGTPLVRIEPEDIPGRELGPGYTHGEMVALAVRRVVEREFAEDLDAEEREELAGRGYALMRSVFERMGRGDKWDEVEDAS